MVFLAFGYSAFLLFQKNLKDFILAAPLGTKSLTKELEERPDELKWDAPETKEEKDEGGVFLILLFYYFQDASIVHINTIYVNSDSAVLNSIKEIVGGIFKFRLDVLHLANTVCAVPGLTPAVKVVFKLFFVPLVLGVLVSVYTLSLFLEKKSEKEKDMGFPCQEGSIGYHLCHSLFIPKTSLFFVYTCALREHK